MPLRHKSLGNSMKTCQASSIGASGRNMCECPSHLSQRDASARRERERNSFPFECVEWHVIVWSSHDLDCNGSVTSSNIIQSECNLMSSCSDGYVPSLRNVQVWKTPRAITPPWIHVLTPRRQVARELSSTSIHLRISWIPRAYSHIRPLCRVFQAHTRVLHCMSWRHHSLLVFVLLLHLSAPHFPPRSMPIRLQGLG